MIDDKDSLPTRFPIAFRRWIREHYYSGKINSTYDIGSRSRLANWMFKREAFDTKMKIYKAWKLIQDAKDDELHAAEDFSEHQEARDAPPIQLDLFSEIDHSQKILKLSFWLLENGFEEEAVLVSGLSKEAVLKRKVRKTRKGKRDRKEWGLFSKKDPKKVLKWFGPNKPSKKQVAKEEARVHAFASTQ
tara:strand:- start:211 stop:777 length:567 start_codon:yes stop_codon:yes gene_type:complete